MEKIKKTTKIRITFITTVLFLLQVFSGSTQENSRFEATVTFKLHSPGLSNDTNVFITGSVAGLGNWNPAKIAMLNKGNNTWTKTVCVTDSIIEYKYTLGSWERENAGASGLPLQNFDVKIKGDTILENNVYFWLDGKKRTYEGQVTGTVKYHRDMKGEGILARDLVVWLPPGYNEQTNRRYPVLYMHDGQNLFDPATSSFGVDWQVDESCDSLIRTNAIEPVIVVGVYNTPDRNDEYISGAKGNAYMEFVANKLKPFIDKTYRTISDREHTIVGGSSLGGLISFMLAWEYPELFSKAICMSPAFKVLDIDYVKPVQEYQGEKKELLLYIDNGGKGLEIKLQPGIDEMMLALDKQGYKNGVNYFWISDPEAKHFESAWAKRLPGALKLFLPNRESSKN